MIYGCDNIKPIKNKLDQEQSPYLLQHKDNPVHWLSWSDEAFELAKKLDRPIFLSIGYATCHWCHVMEHQSFEDEEVAQLMNDTFINIKVDREERPDIDQLYMSVCQLMTGRGGWPLTIIMTPDKKPFFAGTYFPKHGSENRPGMIELTRYIDQLWKNERQKCLDISNKIMAHLIQNNQQGPPKSLDQNTLTKAYEQFSETFDQKEGGFNKAPKFPTPHQYIFLLGYATLFNEPHAKQMALFSLNKMRLGGIYDHIGFGFHRYSTDALWHVPHFEKMLYDQAQLMTAYALAYHISKDPVYKDTLSEMATYLNRELKDPKGGYYSAQDADSEGIEGQFYLWTAKEIDQVLAKRNPKWIKSIFHIEENGNFLDEVSQEKTNQNILFLSKPISKIDPNEIWEKNRHTLFEAREKRVKPLLDDKILTDWNGLMMAGFSDAGYYLNESTYIDEAKTIYQFITTHLTQKDRLLHRYRQGASGIQGTAFDYTSWVYGLIKLYIATQDDTYLFAAQQWNEITLNLFWDNQKGGLITSISDDLIVAQKDIYDGALPSVNGLAYYNFLKLSQLLHDPKLYDKALQLGSTFGQTINRYPAAYTYWLYGELLHQSGFPTLVIIGDLDPRTYQSLKEKLPFDGIIQHAVNEKPSILSSYLNGKGFNQIDQRTTYYYCKNFTCQKPTTELDEIYKSLDQR